MNQDYMHEKAALKNELQQQVAVSVTYDTWTSGGKESYLAATGHYVTEDWILKHTVLAIKRVMGRHTGQHIYGYLASIEQDY